MSVQGYRGLGTEEEEAKSSKVGVHWAAAPSVTDHGQC